MASKQPASIKGSSVLSRSLGNTSHQGRRHGKLPRRADDQPQRRCSGQHLRTSHSKILTLAALMAHLVADYPRKYVGHFHHVVGFRFRDRGRVCAHAEPQELRGLQSSSHMQKLPA